jgi:hypothetical protein
VIGEAGGREIKDMERGSTVAAFSEDAGIAARPGSRGAVAAGLSRSSTRVTAPLRRIEVTGGLLHDLDIEFVPGLNMITRPRGAGKRSVLELLRYAFGVHAVTPEADERARSHALDVSVDGSVSDPVVALGAIVQLDVS